LLTHDSSRTHAQIVVKRLKKMRVDYQQSNCCLMVATLLLTIPTLGCWLLVYFNQRNFNQAGLRSSSLFPSLSLVIDRCAAIAELTEMIDDPKLRQSRIRIDGGLSSSNYFSKRAAAYVLRLRHTGLC
jgi:hypothetical protein